MLRVLPQKMTRVSSENLLHQLRIVWGQMTRIMDDWQ